MAEGTVVEEHIVGPLSAPDDVLRVEHVAKSFGPITALRDINLHLRKGEVLALLGDNGAGKSTLIKILCGFHRPDSGSMWLKGETYRPKSVDDARAHGIDTVFQDLALVDELSVYHNLFLRRERVHKPIPLLSNALMRRHARKALDEIGINIPRLDVPAARLSGGQRQAIAVARTVSGDADIILLDEPLAAMGAKEGAMILDLIARLKSEGNVSIMMIVHNYVHVFQACDRVSLIQDGVISLDKPTSEDLDRGAERDRRRGVPSRPARRAHRQRGGHRHRRVRLNAATVGRGEREDVRDRGRLRHGVRPRAVTGPALRRGARDQRRALPERRHRPHAALERRAAAARLGAAGS